MYYATPLLVLLQHLVDRYNENTCENIRILWNIESKPCAIIHVFVSDQTLELTDATFLKEILVKVYISTKFKSKQFTIIHVFVG